MLSRVTPRDQGCPNSRELGLRVPGYDSNPVCVDKHLAALSRLRLGRKRDHVIELLLGCLPPPVSCSELSHYKISFQRGGPFQPCFESSEQEWPKCYRATSSLDLSWDGDQAAQGLKSPAYEESLPELLHRPLRGRAFSESHLTIEPPSPRRMERRDIPSAKLDETRPEPPRPTRKKGPPPPRPPPPNWEKYRTRRASHYHVYPPESSGSISAFTTVPLEQSHQQNRSSVEAARQHSQSLPLDKHHGDPAKPPASSQCQVQFTPPQESTIPTGTGQPPDQGSPHCYCPSSLWRTPELDVGTRDSPRQVSLLSLPSHHSVHPCHLPWHRKDNRGVLTAVAGLVTSRGCFWMLPVGPKLCLSHGSGLQVLVSYFRLGLSLFL